MFLSLKQESIGGCAVQEGVLSKGGTVQGDVSCPVGCAVHYRTGSDIITPPAMNRMNNRCL